MKRAHKSHLKPQTPNISDLYTVFPYDECERVGFRSDPLEIQSNQDEIVNYGKTIENKSCYIFN